MTSTLPRSELKLLLMLAAVQFTLIMDFMVIMPLGPQLMRQLEISPQQFGGLISAFGITAGVIGLAFAPFADRFDRKRLLLCAYAGFVLATLACGLSPNCATLMVSRALCGACGGICGATIMAIVSDVVPTSRRARGMAILMTSFSVAAALGVPFGLKLAQLWSWEAPFLAVAAIAVLVWMLLLRLLPPVRGHLEQGKVRSGRDFLTLLRDPNAWRGLALMMVVVFGHFTIIPYLSPFLVRNVGVAESDLFLVYLIGGLVTVVSGPIIGKLADRHGRFLIYAILVMGACAIIRVLTASGPRPEWQALVITGLFFMIASGRFIPSQATISMAVPSTRRGAFMSLVACTRDLSAGITTAIGGSVVVEGADGTLLHYDRLGLLAIGVSLASLWVFRRVRSAE
ncbi:MAG TPA: MFS transporter [Luteolibacter sp.]|nr:MFS transporter [Luteolibacter sp.]